MDGVTASGAIFVLLVCLLPAAASILSVLSSVLAFFPRTRLVSIVLALGCLTIYAIVVMQVILTHGSYQHFVEVYNSLPAGRLFRSFIPLAAAVIVICFDIYALKKDRRKNNLSNVIK